MTKSHISNPHIENIEIFGFENQTLSDRNQKIEIGITEAEIKIEATQLTINIITALGSAQSINHPPNLNPKIPRPHREKVVDILSNNEVTKYFLFSPCEIWYCLGRKPTPKRKKTGGKKNKKLRREGV